MDLVVKLSSKDTSNIGILPIASKCVSINFADQCIHIINNKYRLNAIKGITKIQNRESLLKYQSCICNFQRNIEVNHRGMIIIWYNKLFPLLNVTYENHLHMEARVLLDILIISQIKN